METTIETQREICPKHGAFESRRLFSWHWTRCPVCVDESRKEEEAKRAEDERIRAKERWNLQLMTAGIPERFQSRTLQNFLADTPKKQAALAFSKAFADGFDDEQKAGRSAIFLGMPGTGKTHLACGIGQQVMQKPGRHALFTSVLRAIRRIKETWSRDSQETESAAINAMVSPPLLILDEVGIQFGSETEKMMLFDILNERYERRRSTILISNLTLPEVKAYLGERIFDRLREDGGEVVTFDWESHRGGMAA